MATSSSAPLSLEEVHKIQPNEVHSVLKRVMLVDGFDLVRLTLFCYTPL